MKKIILLLFAVFFSFSVFAEEKKSEVKTVDYVDLKLGGGKWYEIARVARGHEEGLVGVTASYIILPDGNIKIVNTAYENTLDGRFKIITGKAKIIDKKTNAKIRASYRWPFWGNYGVLEVGKNYDYVVIGNLNRKSLWVVSRKPQMNEKLYEEILKRAEKQGYDITKLEKPPQKAEKEKK